MDEPRPIPEIGLMIQDGLDSSFEDAFRDAVKISDDRLAVDRYQSGPYAGLALYLPTAIMIFIASSYFGGIFKKIGEEHYAALKEGIVRLWLKARHLKVTAIGKSAKTADFERYQLSYSIVAGLSDNIRLKLVLRMDLTEQESLDAISEFLDLVRRIHFDQLLDAELAILKGIRPIGGTAIVTFDPKSRTIVGTE
jgi:hypothetical protein